MYEALLATQCQAYNQMQQLVSQIFDYDRALFLASSVQRPDTTQIRMLGDEKKELVQKLDTLSLEIEERQQQLSLHASSNPDFSSLPAYDEMQRLHQEATQLFQQLLDFEDLESPAMLEHLTAYKESLELDLQIQEIPEENRTIFFITP